VTEEEKERERQRKRKKVEENNVEVVSKLSLQVLGKAIARVECALPASDATKKVVITKLYKK
jgi:hypothetical protein